MVSCGGLSGGASCSCPAPAASRSSLRRIDHQTQPRQPAQRFSGLPEKCIWSAAPRLKRALNGRGCQAEESRRKVAKSSGESQWASSNLVLTPEKGTEAQGKFHFRLTQGGLCYCLLREGSLMRFSSLRGVQMKTMQLVSYLKLIEASFSSNHSEVQALTRLFCCTCTLCQKQAV